MTAMTAPCTPRTATRWERALLSASERLERAAVRHMSRRAAGADREAAIQAVTESQRTAHAAGALRMFGW